MPHLTWQTKEMEHIVVDLKLLEAGLRPAISIDPPYLTQSRITNPITPAMIRLCKDQGGDGPSTRWNGRDFGAGLSDEIRQQVAELAARVGTA